MIGHKDIINILTKYPHLVQNDAYKRLRVSDFYSEEDLTDKYNQIDLDNNSLFIFLKGIIRYVQGFWYPEHQQGLEVLLIDKLLEINPADVSQYLRYESKELVEVARRYVIESIKEWETLFIGDILQYKPKGINTTKDISNTDLFIYGFITKEHDLSNIKEVDEDQVDKFLSSYSETSKDFLFKTIHRHMLSNYDHRELISLLRRSTISSELIDDMEEKLW